MAAGDAAGEGIPFVGLTGGIGAGKSEALRALERLGAATLSSDAVVHEILATDEARDDLVERLGDEVAPAGRVDRDAVARIVFDDPDGRRWLEEYLWPRVGSRIAAWRSELDSLDPRPRAAGVEGPLAFWSRDQERVHPPKCVPPHRHPPAARARAPGPAPGAPRP